ncbi:BlaI/MecI/CopY family transcriptional regulator [Cuneatibacter sp. NSJ-177]|uniref:BlaI/MecI/CopY family transcriptional regulator n=1 Tax=Cuneatibacter sp. NSJ-177 TaxID=2931401 RepID=UPI001FD299B1|nr:BlaI/MecI/CopY family transcriptional regulator [Cuneatibacter sp. NSJ-177]MCJ7835470.1 BlaI/MecI/CopY family transcriptional regulator [Cuneatibacter sp. NSJ-177]
MRQECVVTLTTQVIVEEKVVKALTECEVVVMKCIWETDHDMALPEIMEMVNRRFQKSWKPQTVSTFLTRLVKKDFLNMYRQGRSFLYHPLVAELDYGEGQINKCADLWCNNDADLFISALNKQRKLKKDEVQRIRALIDDLD